MFNKRFYKSLHKAAKIKKKSKAISRHLGVGLPAGHSYNQYGDRRHVSKSKKKRITPDADVDESFRDKAHLVLEEVAVGSFSTEGGRERKR